MGKMNKHQCLALFYILFGGVLAFLTSQIEFMFSVAAEDVGPRFFPYCCAIGFVLCGAGKFLTSGNAAGKPFLADKKGWLRLAAIIAVMLAYIIAMTYLGFAISTFFLVFVLTCMLADGRRLPLWKVLLFSAVMTAATYFVFVRIINVMLPAGKWTRQILKMLR